MSINDHVALLPQWGQIWINIIVFVPSVCLIILMFNKASRKTAVVALGLFIAGIVGVITLHAIFGMVRLIGLGHVIFWTPAVALLLKKVMGETLPVFVTMLLWIAIVVLGAALVFDYLDVVRWLLGERASIV